MPESVFLLENCNQHAVKAVATKYKYCAVRFGALQTISIGSNIQTQICKLLQSKLKCNMLQQAVARLLYIFFVFELASGYGSIFCI